MAEVGGAVGDYRQQLVTFYFLLDKRGNQGDTKTREFPTFSREGMRFKVTYKNRGRLVHEIILIIYIYVYLSLGDKEYLVNVVVNVRRNSAVVVRKNNVFNSANARHAVTPLTIFAYSMILV